MTLIKILLPLHQAIKQTFNLNIMKTVFQNSDLAHTWANQLQNEGRTPNISFFFTGDEIYSYGYHFLIAKHHNGNVLFTTRSYSNTTRKQISITRTAVSDKKLIFCAIPDGTSHTENFKAWFNIMDTAASKIATARKPTIYLDAIAREFNEVKIYAEYFGLEIPVNILELSTLENKDRYQNIVKERAERAEIERKAKEAKIKKDIKGMLVKWRSFKTERLYLRNGFDYLRFNKEKNRVETSQAVQIPAGIAKQFYNYVLETVKNGGCTSCNTQLLSYDVREINKDFIVVGCHKIEMSEIKRTIKLLV